MQRTNRIKIMLDMLEPFKYILTSRDQFNFEVMKMNKLNTEKRAQMVSCLVEGNSIRATARMCDVAFNTVLKFVPEIGKRV